MTMSNSPPACYTKNVCPLSPQRRALGGATLWPDTPPDIPALLAARMAAPAASPAPPVVGLVDYSDSSDSDAVDEAATEGGGPTVPPPQPQEKSDALAWAWAQLPPAADLSRRARAMLLEAPTQYRSAATALISQLCEAVRRVWRCEVKRVREAANAVWGADTAPWLVRPAASAAKRALELPRCLQHAGALGLRALVQAEAAALPSLSAEHAAALGQCQAFAAARRATAAVAAALGAAMVCACSGGLAIRGRAVGSRFASDGGGGGLALPPCSRGQVEAVIGIKASAQSQRLIACTLVCEPALPGLAAVAGAAGVAEGSAGELAVEAGWTAAATASDHRSKRAREEGSDQCLDQGVSKRARRLQRARLLAGHFSAGASETPSTAQTAASKKSPSLGES